MINNKALVEWRTNGDQVPNNELTPRTTKLPVWFLIQIGFEMKITIRDCTGFNVCDASSN